MIEDSLGNRAHSVENRLAALSLLSNGLDAEAEGRLLQIASDLEDGPVLAAVLDELGTRTNIEGDSLLLAKLVSPESTVRAAAIRALTARGTADVGRDLGRLLNDLNADVLREAVASSGVFEIRDHVDRVLERDLE